jgi:membrane protein DedA with SNARE-associated domain
VRPFPTAVAVLAALVLLERWRKVGWLVRVALLVVVVLAAVYGSGAVPAPDIEAFLLDVGETLGAWTYLLVGGLAFLETGAFVGLLAPGETAVIAGGVIAGQGQVDVVVLLLLVWACCVGGDNVSFWLGRRLGRRFLVRHGPKVRITEERLQEVEAFFERRGGVTILIGRFLGLIRALAPFIAGSSGMRYSRFLPYDVVGCGLWASAFTLLGYFSWRNIDRATEIASTAGLGIGTAVAVGVVAFLARRHLRTPEQRARARAWVRRRLAR